VNKLELAICAVFSVLLHFAIAEALEQLPARDPVKPRRVQITVVDAPKPPEVVAPPEPPPPAPEPAPTPPPEAKPQPQPKAETPKPQPPKTQITAVVPETTPTTSTTAVAVETTGDDEPVYSATMSSSSSGTTSGSAATTGGTGAKPGGTGAGGTTNGSGTEPIAAYEATKMPMPRGQCFGKYTDAAKTAGVEGTVVLDLTVSEDGKPREIKVTQGLSHGLDEAAIAAVRACSFSPGEKEGKRVPVRIRGFKITFVLQEAR
jgi:periplasmic protein TonB